MTIDQKALTFIEESTSAGMITLRRDGTPHATRVGLAVVGGKIWSSALWRPVCRHSRPKER